MATSKFYQLHSHTSRGFNWGKPVFFSNIIPRLFSSILYFPLRAVFNYFFFLEIESEVDFKNIKTPIIIAPNHASWIDPFVIGICFPFSSKLSPIHYATWWKYFYFPPFTPFLWLLGGFPVRPGLGLERSLREPIVILERGGIVGIFPTGKRTRKHSENNPPKPKRGTAYLSLKTDTPILPIKIEGHLGMKFLDVLKRKHRLKIKIGKPFYLFPRDLSRPENLNESSNYIMHKINSL